MSLKELRECAVTTLIVVAAVVLLLLSLSAIVASLLLDDDGEVQTVSRASGNEVFSGHVCPQAHDAVLRCLGTAVTKDAIDPRIEVESACQDEIGVIVSILSACDEGAMSDSEAANAIEHIAAGGRRRGRPIDL